LDELLAVRKNPQTAVLSIVHNHLHRQAFKVRAGFKDEQ
jgi:hypothetical protein